MIGKNIPLYMIPCGKSAEIRELTASGYLRSRLMDLGLIAGTKVESLRRSPFGDPTAYAVRGAVIALRSEEAAKILVKPI